jgi:predicted transcriptional regulator
MKVTVKIESRRNSDQLIRHSLDLYHAKQVDHLCEMIASQLEIRSSKASQIISQMTTALETYRQRRLEGMKPKTPQLHEMTPREREAATSYLKNPELMINTANAIKQSGIVGEEKNAMIGYVVYLSRKREKALHVMYLGASGSGKTHVQEGLANLMPIEDKIEATGLSDQALYYEGMKLKGKILFIEDIDGAENIMYVIRELQSKGKIIKRVAWRDNKGNTQTIEVVAEGPVVISSCTTQEKIYEDNANRCILLYIDQSKEQDKRVMDYIKAKSMGSIKEVEQEEIRKQIQNVQRVLKPIKVYNPYASMIDLPSEIFKPRRSLPLLLGFIETVTFYHQHQRKVKISNQGQRYIESTYEDVQISFDLLKDVLFSKSDELTKSAREFLEMLKRKVKRGDTFYTKKIRKEIRMNVSNLKRYMIELQRNDYVKVKNGNRYRGYEYEITDYGEYEDLKNSVDSRLEEILLNIRALSGSVVHSSSKEEMNQLSALESVS